MKTKTIVVQYKPVYKSVYSPTGWIDDGGGYDAGKDGALSEAREHAKLLKVVNPNVRIIERTIEENEVS